METHTDYVFDLSAKELDAYEQFASTGKLSINGATVEMRDPLARLQGLSQITSGFIYDDNGRAQTIGESKLQCFADIYEEQNGRPVMVIVRHRQDLELLRKVEPNLEAITGATPMAERPRILDRWNANAVKLLALSPQAAGHGLNAQHSDCELQVHFSLNWSSELYTQVVARLVRTNQKNKITVLRMVAAETIDTFIVQAIENKTLSQQKLLDATRLLFK
jgi:SNF2 family DNA or RNA helicase